MILLSLRSRNETRRPRGDDVGHARSPDAAIPAGGTGLFSSIPAFGSRRYSLLRKGAADSPSARQVPARPRPTASRMQNPTVRATTPGRNIHS